VKSVHHFVRFVLAQCIKTVQNVFQAKSFSMEYALILALQVHLKEMEFVFLVGKTVQIVIP